MFLTIRRVMAAQYRIDFRKRFDGLLAEAYRLGADPYAGDCIVFYSKDSRQLRIIVGDRLGLLLICRRFEGGALKRNFAFARDPSAQDISQAELAMLLAGNTYQISRRVKSWK